MLSSQNDLLSKIKRSNIIATTRWIGTLYQFYEIYRCFKTINLLLECNIGYNVTYIFSSVTNSQVYLNKETADILLSCG